MCASYNAEGENIRKKVTKEKITSPKVNVDSENSSSRDENTKFEAAVSALPESTLEEHLKEILKDYRFLQDVPLKTRKEEATKPIYLIRYE